MKLRQHFSPVLLGIRSQKGCISKASEVKPELVYFRVSLIPVVDNLHIAVLFDPQLSHDDVVHTTRGVHPCVCLIMPATSLLVDHGSQTNGIHTKPVYKHVHKSRFINNVYYKLYSTFTKNVRTSETSLNNVWILVMCHYTESRRLLGKF